ncbi:hypothetical protein Tco_0680787 [Tanacetum coccineum]|uniref:Reverse transcriptase domain-containing protein n=1 Tax=Tanacetum coccineum TaxID=301880 RepID=A0ABQ4XLJ5_9ASTR
MNGNRGVNGNRNEGVNRNGNGGGNGNGNGNGNEGGVVGLTRCALTWWNSHKRTVRVDAAYAMKWTKLMKLMT